jgi:hypothetical protein
VSPPIGKVRSTLSITEETMPPNRSGARELGVEAAYMGSIESSTAVPSISDNACAVTRKHLELAEVRSPGTVKLQLYRPGDGSGLGAAVREVAAITASVSASSCRSSSMHARSPRSPNRSRCSRSSSSRPASKACTCAAAGSPEAACGGPTGSRTSAPRSLAW